ncbi:MAG: hypothetical protein RSA41_08580 [Christensenella sp.]
MYNVNILLIRNAEHFGSRELAPLRGLWAEPQGLKGAGGWYPPLQGLFVAEPQGLKVGGRKIEM